jgi:hypothetical protein
MHFALLIFAIFMVPAQADQYMPPAVRVGGGYNPYYYQQQQPIIQNSAVNPYTGEGMPSSTQGQQMERQARGQTAPNQQPVAKVQGQGEVGVTVDGHRVPVHNYVQGYYTYPVPIDGVDYPAEVNPQPAPQTPQTGIQFTHVNPVSPHFVDVQH